MGAPRTKELHDVRDVQQVLAIGPNMEARDIFYFLKMVDSQTLWKALLDLQYHLCKFAELPFVYRDRGFLEAKRVLEIGHGDEKLTGSLSAYFPDKKFYEAPLATRFVMGAKRKTKDCLQDIERSVRASGEKKFDCVVLRLVVQKVSQLGLFISRMSDLVERGGMLLVIDSYDPLLGWQPSIPTLDNLMKRLSEEQAKTGAGRTAAEKVHRRASLYDFRPARNEKGAVSSAGAGEVGRRDFYTYFLLLSEAMVRAYGPILDQTALLRDLDAWIADERAHAQFGLHFVGLERC